MKDVNSQGVFDVAFRDYLHLNWIMTSGCNYRCSYCFDANKPNSETFSKDRIFETIDRVFALHRPGYVFTLSCVEPTLNPHLSELVDYIFSSGTNSKIVLISNGSRTPEYYSRLLRCAPDCSLSLNISIHTEYAEANQIASVVAAMTAGRQPVTLRLMHDPAFRANSVKIHTRLLELRQTVPFSLEIRTLRMPPKHVELDSRYTEEDFHWMKKGVENFMAAAEGGPPEMSFQVGESGYGLGDTCIPAIHSDAMRAGLTNFKDFFCCGGLNLLRIKADFTWSGGVCPLLPYYSGKIDTHLENDDLVRIVRCTYDNCGCDANFVLPKFKDEQRASNYVTAFRNRILHYKDSHV